MKLKSFRVQRFRNIVDSGEIPVHEAVTCFVGKNEAGKSALLEALFLLNPVYEQRTFDIEFQFPTWLLARERRTGNPSDVKPISATFQLEDQEISEIEAALGADAVKSDRVIVSRAYGGRRFWSFDLDEETVVETLRGENPSFPKSVKSANTLQELDTAISDALQSLGENAPQRNPLQRIAQIRANQDNDPAWKIAMKAVGSGFPKFFWFTAYDTMPGIVDLKDLDDLESSEVKEAGGGGLQAARALVRLARSTPEALGTDRYELRKQELATVSIDLTQEVFEYWRQNQSLRVDIDLDLKEGPAPDGNRQIVKRELHIRVEDTRTGHGNNFQERSAGFQWFFSFLAAFSEFENLDEPVVVLLDEPGLNLHGRAQADYLRFIDDRLAPVGLVMYTTHSPFMVRVDSLDRVRIVEDTGPEKWVQVSSDVLAHDPDSLFPLQGALGYDIAQSLFIGTTNLVVEGLADFMYLATLSDFLEDAGRTHLEDVWRVLPAGGSSNIATFVALIGPHLETTALVDSGTEKVARLETAVEEGLLNPNQLITVGSILGQQQADIEDLFTIRDYLELYNGAFKTNLAESDLAPGARVVDRIERSSQGGKFNHRRPAQWLLRNIDKVTLEEESLDNFEALFQAIEKTRDRE